MEEAERLEGVDAGAGSGNQTEQGGDGFSQTMESTFAVYGLGTVECARKLIGDSLVFGNKFAEKVVRSEGDFFDSKPILKARNGVGISTGAQRKLKVAFAQLHYRCVSCPFSQLLLNKCAKLETGPLLFVSISP